MSNLTPKKIVEELDKWIIGQQDAKKAVAIALRNRWRRMQLPEELRNEVTPKNILMIGPTGVGKTEIARRLAKLADAPFIKIEATKFTEVGYVGRDVESIIRDLVDISFKRLRDQQYELVKDASEAAALERIVDILIPKIKFTVEEKEEDQKAKEQPSASREIFKNKVLSGELDETEIELELSQSSVGVEIMAPPGMEDMTNQLQGLFQSLSSDKVKKRKIKIKDAKKLLQEEESLKRIDRKDIESKAITSVEENGIVFLDEIDKVAQNKNRLGGEVSREGVQRDLLPVIEGCTISTKYGMVKTDHILFIASGAFHLSKPSDLIPELQGRLPIRVELSALKTEEFIRILTEPDASLTEQYQALLRTENVKIEFTKDGIEKIAEIAFLINSTTENIGARRLHTVIERVFEEISFNTCELSGKTVVIDGAYVDQRLSALAKDEDLSRFIL